MNTQKIWTIDDIKCANTQAGYHFFSKNTLRFFNSHILKDVEQHKLTQKNKERGAS